jgi:hypothetical protein
MFCESKTHYDPAWSSILGRRRDADAVRAVFTAWQKNHPQHYGQGAYRKNYGC